jgi:hypothetical protein
MGDRVVAAGALMSMIPLASFIVVTKHAHATRHIGEPILEPVRRAR